MRFHLEDLLLSRGGHGRLFSFFNAFRCGPIGQRPVAPGVEMLETRALPSGGSLVAAYSFDEGSGGVVADASGNGNTGTISNATWVTSGKFGNALSFNGNNAWVTVPNSASLNLTSGFTLEAWVKPSSLTNSRDVLLKERSAGLSYGLYATDPNGKNLPENGQVNTGGTTQIAVGNTTLSNNAWYFLATTYDGSNLRIYVNGSLVGTQAAAGSIMETTGALRIGGNAVWGQYFKGLIDNVRIYNQALTQTGIQTDMTTAVTTSPLANAGSQESGKEGSPVTFAGSETGGTNPLTYSWTFGDGGTGKGSLTPTHTYVNQGTYTAVLTVTDALGRSSASSTTATIADVAPTASTTGPYSGVAGSAIAFSASATDPSPADVAAGFKFAWTFGDGSTGSGANASHIYAASGTYTATVTATAVDGATGSATATVTVNAAAPVANAGSQQSGKEGSPVAFAGSETGGTNPLTYSWTFGDGGTSSGSLTPSYTYVNQGVYTAVLTVTDSLGRSSTSSTTATIADVAPTASAGGPYSGVVGSVITLSGSATDPSPADNAAGFTFAWSFGDGGTGTGANASHAYTAAGTYTATVTATATDGATGSASATVTVNSSSYLNEPLLYQSNVQYVGAFRVPNYYNSVDQMSYGGTALAFNPANNSLFTVGLGQALAEISIPSSIVNSSNLDALTTDTILQPWTPVLPNLPSNPSAAGSIGGLLVDNGQLIGTAYNYYEGANSQVASHFVLNSLNLSTAGVQGLYQVGNVGARMVAGYMAPIPSEWQAALGEPYLTGQSDIPIISTTSSGPAAIGFDPSTLGSGVAPATPYVYYPSSNPLGAYTGPANALQSGTASVNGVVFVPGTSSVLFVGKTGTNFEGYGMAADYGDPNDGGKGPHSLNGQYAVQVWAYNANDLLAVKQGTLQPWQVQPYDVWNVQLPISAGEDNIGGVAFDAATGRLYVSLMNADHEASCSSLPLIEVFQVTVPTGTPAPAAPQIGALGATSTAPAPTGSSSPYLPGAVPVGTAVVLTAENVYAITPGATVNQVAFYISANNSAPFSSTNDTLLGYGTGTQNLPNGSSSNWTLTIPTNTLASGTSYTIFAQAQDSNGLLADPIATTLPMA